jgi:tRNA dimethylallyltransferase
MLERGLLEEVRALMARCGEPLPRPLAAIGYRQAVSVLRGELTPEAAEQSIVTETLRFAKRQMTWFRHQTPEDVRWFEDPEGAHGFAVDWLATANRPSA